MSRVRSPICVMADFRCRQPSKRIGTPLTRPFGPPSPEGEGAELAAAGEGRAFNCSIAAMFVRCDRPTYKVPSIASTSPPSRVAGGSIRRKGRNRSSAVATLSVSARRETAPGRVMIATSSRTTAASSTNTPSGMSGASAIRMTLQPCAARRRSYSSCEASIGRRST